MHESRVNRRKYELAQLKIIAGAWTIDPVEDVLISRKTGEPLAPNLNGDGYPRMNVWDPETRNQLTVLRHRVVWEYVNGEVPDGLEVNHINGVKTNCKISNLEAITQHENILHMHRTGLWPSVIRSSAEVEIAAALDAGMTHTEAARVFSVGTGTVHRVNARRPGYVAPIFDATRTHKKCPDCAEVKGIDEFHRVKSRFDGHSTYCKPCSAVRHRDFMRARGASPAV